AARVLAIRHHQGQVEGVSLGALHRRTQVAARMPDTPCDPFGRCSLGRHDEVGLVFTLARVADQYRLAELEVGERPLHQVDRGVAHGVAPISRSTYFAMTSTSTLATSPTANSPKVVSVKVVGMSDT